MQHLLKKTVRLHVQHLLKKTARLHVQHLLKKTARLHVQHLLKKTARLHVQHLSKKTARLHVQHLSKKTARLHVQHLLKKAEAVRAGKPVTQAMKKEKKKRKKKRESVHYQAHLPADKDEKAASLQLEAGLARHSGLAVPYSWLCKEHVISVCQEWPSSFSTHRTVVYQTNRSAYNQSPSKEGSRLWTAVWRGQRDEKDRKIVVPCQRLSGMWTGAFSSHTLGMGLNEMYCC